MKKPNQAFAFENDGGNSNQTDDWLTPPELIRAAGPFDLDPCAHPSQPWATAATQFCLPEQNGLLLPWSGCVWCNPPYGREVKHWAKRLALHGDGLFLVFARTETQALVPLWKHSAAMLFFANRLVFCRPDGTPQRGGGAPSLLAAFGEKNISRLERVREQFPGYLVRDWDR